MAYEAGIRGQATKKLSWDLAVFFNDYDRLIYPLTDPLGGMGTPPIILVPMTFENAFRGDTYGFELAANYKPTPAWQVRAAYSFLVMDFSRWPGSPIPQAIEGETPGDEFYLQLSFDLGRHWQLDLTGRYADDLPAFGVPSYIVGDLRLACAPQR